MIPPETLNRMAREAGMVQLHGATFPNCAMTPAVLERFAHLATQWLAHNPPPPIVIQTAGIDPAILRELLAKAPAMPLVPMPAEPTPEAIAAAVAAEREACAWLAETEWSTDREKAYGDELAAAIRARGAA